MQHNDATRVCDAILAGVAEGDRLGAEAWHAWGLHYRGVAFAWVKTRRDGVIVGAQGVRASVTKPTIELVLVGSPMAKGRPLRIGTRLLATSLDDNPSRANASRCRRVAAMPDDIDRIKFLVAVAAISEVAPDAIIADVRPATSCPETFAALYRANGSVFGPMQVDPTAGTVRTLTTDGRSLAHPLTAAGLDLAVRDAVQHAPVGEAYSGAIDFLLRKPALARHGRGSLVR